MPVDRVHRLLRLAALLQSGSGYAIQDLTAELKVSRRTVFRDFKLLQEAGISAFFEPGVGYRIARDSFLPPLNLTIPETLGVMLLAKRVSGHNGWPLASPAMSAINKLSATVPQPMRQACAMTLAQVSVNPGAQPFSDAEARYYPILQACIADGRACRIAYRSAVEKRDQTMKLHPYLLHYSVRSWYVMGWTDLHNTVRVFKLSRFKAVESLSEQFNKPKRFRAADKLGKAWQLNPEGKVYDVELVFSAKVAMNVSEVRWHPSQRQEILPDGRCRMTFEVDGIGEIAWWVCGYADQVVVVRPAELRKRVTGMLQSALDQYTGDKPAGSSR